MSDKIYFRIAIGWTIFLLLLTVAMISSEPKNTSGGEQYFLTSIAKSIFAFIIGQVILLIIYFSVRTKKDT